MIPNTLVLGDLAPCLFPEGVMRLPTLPSTKHPIFPLRLAPVDSPAIHHPSLAPISDHVPVLLDFFHEQIGMLALGIDEQPREGHDRGVQGKGLHATELEMNHVAKLQLVVLRAQDLIPLGGLEEILMRVQGRPLAQDKEQRGVFNADVKPRVGPNPRAHHAQICQKSGILRRGAWFQTNLEDFENRHLEKAPFEVTGGNGRGGTRLFLRPKSLGGMPTDGGIQASGVRLSAS
ncbi:hypothetical protein BP6252_12012 [Coleophoma cylindrospora]|uniref:Uncharacterized protein n=1 Tax=Coleophoma cylindrospora TaxID=1849047 RepID=A0A3D8QFQ4_9HELO|nr:hypothetical protein BP6252_12012 [Coleophoma cylindrospora]